MRRESDVSPITAAVVIAVVVVVFAWLMRLNDECEGRGGVFVQGYCVRPMP
jgi:hypothetical protein